MGPKRALGLLNVCFCIYYSRCSGTTDIVCGDFTEAEACDGLSSFGCGWVAGGQSDAPSEAPSESPLPPAEDCPLSTAIVIEYDPLGMFVAGSTAGAPANLPTEGVCGATPDSPTVWYRFDTQRHSPAPSLF